MKLQTISSHLIILLLALSLMGCATGARFTRPREPRGDTALLFVFRPNSPPYACRPTIMVNGVKAAKLTNKGYFDLGLKPGSYTLKADWSWNSGVSDREFTFQAEGGQTYYVLVAAHMGLATIGIMGTTVTPVYSFHGYIELVDSKTALATIVECGLVKTAPAINGLLILPK